MQEKCILSNLCFSVKSFENAHGNAHNKSPLGTVTIVKQLCCTGLKKKTWNHTTRKTQCKDCELTYMWEFTRGQNHIEKLSTTVTIVKQLGCTVGCFPPEGQSGKKINSLHIPPPHDPSK